MCFAASLALLVLLATPWLTIGSDAAKPPSQTYSGAGLLFSGYGTDLPMGSSGLWLFRAYLLLALVCLVFPATISAVVASCAGFAVTVLIIIIKPEPSPASSSGIEYVDWNGAPTIAVGIWVVAVFVSVAGWSTGPGPTVRTAG